MAYETDRLSSRYTAESVDHSSENDWLHLRGNESDVEMTWNLSANQMLDYKLGPHYATRCAAWRLY